MSQPMFYVAEDKDRPGHAFAACTDDLENLDKQLAEWVRRGGVIHRVNKETFMKMTEHWSQP